MNSHSFEIDPKSIASAGSATSVRRYFSTVYKKVKAFYDKSAIAAEQYIISESASTIVVINGLATTAEYTALYPDGSTFPKKDFYTVELTRYDDYAELTANVTDFSSFSTDYWDVTAGYPVWKTV